MRSTRRRRRRRLRRTVLPAVDGQFAADGFQAGGYFAHAADQQHQRLAAKIEREGLSVRAVEQLVQEFNEREPAEKVVYKSPHIRDLEERLRRSLGTRVTIKEGRGRGRIVIDFYSNDDFDRILGKLE